MRLTRQQMPGRRAEKGEDRPIYRICGQHVHPPPFSLRYVNLIRKPQKPLFDGTLKLETLHPGDLMIMNHAL